MKSVKIHPELQSPPPTRGRRLLDWEPQPKICGWFFTDYTDFTVSLSPVRRTRTRAPARRPHALATLAAVLPAGSKPGGCRPPLTLRHRTSAPPEFRARRTKRPGEGGSLSHDEASGPRHIDLDQRQPAASEGCGEVEPADRVVIADDGAAIPLLLYREAEAVAVVLDPARAARLAGELTAAVARRLRPTDCLIDADPSLAILK